MIALLYRMSDRLRDRARRRSWNPDAATGRRGEDLAHRFLRTQGLTVVARNYRPRSGAGEIDLVAWDGPVLVFVEVKSRATGEFGEPERAIGAGKEEAWRRAAADYLRVVRLPAGRARYDIVSVVNGAVEWKKAARNLSPTL